MIFTEIEVTKTKDNFFYIYWDAAPSPTTTPDPSITTTTPAPSELVDDYNFQIYWARDPASGFLPVLGFDGNPVQIDGAIGPLSYLHRLNQYDFNQDSYYKVLAINKIDPTINLFSSISFVGIFFDGVQDTIHYVEDLLYRNYSGEKCLVIKRKSFGARCTNCWSSERQQMIKSHCDICHGTGYLAGWYQPIPIQISFDSNPNSSNSEKEWENVFNVKRARLSNYPIVRPKDMIINLVENKRYVVNSPVETTKLPKKGDINDPLSNQSYLLSQILTLQELNTDDNEYNLDIDNITAIPESDEGDTGTSTTNNRYFGVSSNTVMSNSDILSLNKEPITTIINTHNYNCSSGEYIWICYPTRFGPAKFMFNGFETTFNVTVQSVTNEENYTEDFNCCRSYRLQHDSNITLAVLNG